jgi:NAD+ synthase (glutamine-hydrolysing)
MAIWLMIKQIFVWPALPFLHSFPIFGAKKIDMPLKTDIKLAVAQMEVVPGHPDKNITKILEKIEAARHAGDDLVVFPEMAVPGYFLSDEWENTAFVKDAYGYNDAIIGASKNITVIWGNVDIDSHQMNEDGRLRKYNAAFIAQNGKLLGKTHKTLLPKYREFDDARHFYSLRKDAWDQGKPVQDLLQPFPVSINDTQVKLGLILCEDMWSDDYAVKPVRILQSHGADMIVNISCSPWTWRKNDKRHRVVADRLKEHPVPFVYANNVGIQNNGKNYYLFDGNSTIYNADGSLHKVAQDYTEELLRATLSAGNKAGTLHAPPLSKERDAHELHQGLLFGLKKIFASMGHPKAVIGLSGGIDSALSAALLSQALGPEKVFAVNMPSRFNSQTTRSAAAKLAKNLKIHYATVPIQEAFEYTVQQINSTLFKRMDGTETTVQVQLSSLNEENVQARDRGSRVLAGIASALGAVFVNNGNKTEISIGYATLYGDVNGALAPIGDLFKGEVYQLARYINQLEGWDLIPNEIFDLPASAELSAAQNVDENKGDPVNYPYHDKLMRAFIEFRLDPEDILRLYHENRLMGELGIDETHFRPFFPDTRSFVEDLEHKWALFKNSYFKRIQAPPIIAVSKRAFGFDLREAQNGVHYTREYQRLKGLLLMSS